MRDFGKVKTTIWDSEKFKGLSSDDLRMFYLYLHTCQHVNSIGCFRLKVLYISADLRWTEKASDRAIKALCVANLIKWDNKQKIILIVDFLENSPITNIKHGVGAVKLGISLPECPLKHEIMAELIADKYAGNVTELEAYDRPINTPTHTTETEPETDMETETEPETDTDGIIIPGKVDEIALAVSLFNELASEVGLAQVQKLTPPRKTKLNSRLKDAGGIEGWKIALDMVRASDFLSGKKSEWKADFDFLITPSKFVKVMEGSYANVKPANPGGGSQQHTGFAAQVAKGMKGGRNG